VAKKPANKRISRTPGTKKTSRRQNLQMGFDFRRYDAETVAGSSARCDPGLLQAPQIAENGDARGYPSARCESARKRCPLIVDSIVSTAKQGFRAHGSRNVQANRTLITPNLADAQRDENSSTFVEGTERFCFGLQQLILGDCLQWLASAPRSSISAVITDPPYGLIEYSAEQQRKLRAGRGGVWRIPPSFDGAKRKALPRFTVLSNGDREAITTFFERWGRSLLPVLKPGGHVLVAGNPLVSPLVAHALERAGLQRRGEVVRLVRTFRGGDKPKGAEDEFAMVSTMPRSCWEPWGLYRKPMDHRTVAGNLRTWGVGALRRISSDTPFLDVIESGTTPDRERALAPHPSLKPQAFLRRAVNALLPLGKGVVLDTFAGCATTLAACEALGVEGLGVELDPHFFKMACSAIPKLAALDVEAR